MISVGIKILKNRLSHYVRLAAAGETVLVTDRDKVVAQFGPPGPERAAEVHDVLLADAVRKGWVTPALAKDYPLPRDNPRFPLSKILDDLSSDREDR